MNASRNSRRFVVDSMLGNVAKWLRVLGFDTASASIRTLDQLERFRKEGRTAITRATRWRSRAGVVFLEADEPDAQLREVVSRLAIRLDEVDLLSRCLECNEPLEPVEQAEVLGRVPEFVARTETSFSRCPKCGRILWPGSHVVRMQARLRDMLGWSL
ncbi:Mut7-C RNAse domain-containing protein [Desulfoglaeba alkanexedens]|uniref:Mut7-C RNAse domain-containing protein n=1 Tax=Desulfoglaeba alkanexedens ALDC TaxID=980445 RepID=A0A4P8KZB0_9BACT|nr:Mut7-C RNAse domain-containing protein [Desulfoglaeba alkanexedens]QCQ20876.1 hypothetical protein FDQ92_00875 [Desulfoglaeba alkanexedens ALDC]